MPRAVKVPAGAEECGLDASIWGMTFDTAEECLAEMERQSGKQWEMVGKGVKQRRVKCLSGTGPEPYRKPPVVGWNCVSSMWMSLVSVSISV
ncbi:hypothetical protein KIPB_001144 [Kipferlia bialata]|uniref:Uncharacterized protein n=1 Tax=Kipferlia bialata TaxID=797122 RepID=A0A391NTW7_9EUKA|nr:hypothetical protein KIPB_001144 [Kipferlia bialata]|eukprot:g1144.t1